MQVRCRLPSAAATALLWFFVAAPGLAQVSVADDDEEARWKFSEERLTRTFSLALQLLAAPHTESIRSALADSQKNWDAYRRSQCRLEATAMAFQSTFDERNVRRCVAREADGRTRYIQNLVP